MESMFVRDAGGRVVTYYDESGLERAVIKMDVEQVTMEAAQPWKQLRFLFDELGRGRFDRLAEAKTVFELLARSAEQSRERMREATVAAGPTCPLCLNYREPGKSLCEKCSLDRESQNQGFVDFGTRIKYAELAIKTIEIRVKAIEGRLVPWYKRLYRWLLGRD